MEIPVDFAFKGVFLSELVDYHGLWWNEPQWLKLDCSHWRGKHLAWYHFSSCFTTGGKLYFYIVTNTRMLIIPLISSQMISADSNLVDSSAAWLTNHFLQVGGCKRHSNQSYLIELYIHGVHPDCKQLSYLCHGSEEWQTIPDWSHTFTPHFILWCWQLEPKILHHFQQWWPQKYLVDSRSAMTVHKTLSWVTSFFYVRTILYLWNGQ